MAPNRIDPLAPPPQPPAPGEQGLDDVTLKDLMQLAASPEGKALLQERLQSLGPIGSSSMGHSTPLAAVFGSIADVVRGARAGQIQGQLERNSKTTDETRARVLSRALKAAAPAVQAPSEQAQGSSLGPPSPQPQGGGSAGGIPDLSSLFGAPDQEQQMRLRALRRQPLAPPAPASGPAGGAVGATAPAVSQLRPEQLAALMISSGDPVVSQYGLQMQRQLEGARTRADKLTEEQSKRDFETQQKALDRAAYGRSNPVTDPTRAEIEQLTAEQKRLANDAARKKLNAPPPGPKRNVRAERFDREKLQQEVPGFVDLDPSNPHPISQANADELRKASTAHDYVTRQLAQLAPIIAAHPLPKSKEMADAEALIAEMQGPIAAMNDFNLTQGHQDLQGAMLGNPEEFNQLVNSGRLQTQIQRLQHSADLALETRARGMQRVRQQREAASPGALGGPSSPTPTGRFKMIKGVKYLEMSDGSAQPAGG